MPTIAVYIKAKHWRALEEEGKDPSQWVRDLVARALELQSDQKKDEQQ